MAAAAASDAVSQFRKLGWSPSVVADRLLARNGEETACYESQLQNRRPLASVGIA